jgi:hypothetical protein
MEYTWTEQLKSLKSELLELTEMAQMEIDKKDKIQCDKRMPKIISKMKKRANQGYSSCSFGYLNPVIIRELKAANFHVKTGYFECYYTTINWGEEESE